MRFAKQFIVYSFGCDHHLCLAVSLITALALPACNNSSGSNSNPANAPAAVSPASANSTQKAKACLGIIDGQTTSAYPATYLLEAPDLQNANNFHDCTGTFISDNAMVTAGHCVPPNDVTKLHAVGNSAQIDATQKVLSGGAAALQAFYDPSLIVGPDGAYAVPSFAQTYLDVAIVIFPDNTSQAVVNLPAATAGPMPANTPFTVVGYGEDDLSVVAPNLPTVTKRAGTTTVFASGLPQPFSGLYVTKGWIHPGEAAQHGATFASTAYGDSGGPMMVGQELIGIVQGANLASADPTVTAVTGTDAMDLYVDLATPSFQKLLQQAQAAGARTSLPSSTVSTAASSGTACN